MNIILRLRPLLLILLLLSFVVLPVQAAEDDVFCGDLAQADCDMLIASAAAMEELDSVTYDMNFVFGGIVVDGQPVEMTFKSDGTVFYGREEINAVTDEILDTTIRQILEMAENGELLTRVVALTERVLKAPAADIHIDINIPVEDPNAPSSIAAQIKYVDGTVYLTSPLLAMAMPDMPPDQWLGLDLVRGMHMIVEALQNVDFAQMMAGAGGGLPFPPGDFAAPSPGPEGEAPPAAPGSDFFNRLMAVINAPYWKEMDTPEYDAMTMKIVRLDDAEVGGVPAAVFQTTFDFAALAETEPFQQAFHDIFALQTEIQGLTPEQSAAMESVILEMVAGLEMTITESIGLEDHFTYAVNMTWGMSMDTKAIVQAAAGEEALADIPEKDLQPMDMTFTYDMTLSDHNQPVEIVAPDADKVISVIDMMRDTMSGAAMDTR